MTDSSSLMDKLTEEWSARSLPSSTNLYANEGLTSLCIGAGFAAIDSLTRTYHAVRTRSQHTEDYEDDPNSIPLLEGLLGIVIVGSEAAYEAAKHLRTKPHPNDYDEEELTTLSDIGALAGSIAAYRAQQLGDALIRFHVFYAHNQKHKPWESP